MRLCGFSISILSVLFLISGCGKNGQGQFQATDSIIEPEPRCFVPFEKHETKNITDLQSNDVIVAVNGVALKKHFLDEMAMLRTKGLLMDKKNSPMSVAAMIDNFRKTYPQTFVAQRLLMDNAIELGVVTTNEIVRHVTDVVNDAIEKGNKTLKSYFAPFEGLDKCHLYELVVSFAMNKLIKEKIPPITEVDDRFVEDVLVSIREDNARANVTNSLYGAKMRELRQDIISGNKVFPSGEKEPKLLFGEGIAADEAGLWGTFTEDDIEEAATANMAFNLKIGEVSEVIEEGNGFRIVKLIKIIPAEEDADGEIVNQEKRTFAHIYKEKIPLYVEESKVVLSNSLKMQMQMQAINEYVHMLTTNGHNKVEYPHGRQTVR